MADTGSKLFNRQVAGIFLMAAGWGWNAGNFVQPVNMVWGVVADIFHVVLLGILLPPSLSFLGAAVAGREAHGARNGIAGLAVFGIIGCLVMVALGVINPDHNSVGVHSPQDWMPVLVQNAGNLLLLSALLPAGRAVRAVTARIA